MDKFVLPTQTDEKTIHKSISPKSLSQSSLTDVKQHLSEEVELS